MTYRYEHGTARLGDSLLVGTIEDHGTGHHSISIDEEDTETVMSLGPEWVVTFDVEAE